MKTLKHPSKKKALMLSVTNSAGSRSITPREHLLRQMALRFLVDKRMKITEVARLLKTSIPMIKRFFEDENFVKELEERVDTIHGIDKDYRVEQAKITLFHLYEELRKREVFGELVAVDARQLHKMIVDTQKELRLDTPDGFTSKIGVADLGSLQDRFNKSLSGKLYRMKKTMTPMKKKKVKKISREDIGEKVYESAENRSG